MPKPSRQAGSVQNSRKAKEATHQLFGRLISEGYTIATPIPDTGDDVWWWKPGMAQVERLQVKTIHSVSNNVTSKSKVRKSDARR